jgi:rhodanese-related sulfurtransferase
MKRCQKSLKLMTCLWLFSRIPHIPLVRRCFNNSPTAFDLVDIRPPEHFSDYHIRGAINVAVADVLSSARVAGSFDVSLTFITI